MQTVSSSIPDIQTLTAGLTSALRVAGCTDGAVTVLDRKPNALGSTFPSEVVTCQLGDGRELQLFCKYETEHMLYKGMHIQNSYGHRGGVTYEAAVYHHVLRPLQASTPTYFGTHSDTATGETWLILEYVDKNVRPSKETPDRLVGAARWIGRFHAAAEERLSNSYMSVLNRYDFEYYLGWACRTAQFAGDFHQSFPWLAVLCKRFENLVDSLLALPLTVIHGEYYYKNVLFRDTNVYPIDWESAAIAAGEIDLAALTDGAWPAEIVRQCELEYQQTRWPEDVPSDFERRLDLARFYLHFRWLGDLKSPLRKGRPSRRLEEMRSIGEQLGLI